MYIQNITRALTGIFVAITLTGSALAQVPSPEASEYVVQPEDQLNINVFQEGDLSGTFLVTKAGTVSMALIGEFNVANQSPDQIAQLIRAKLLDGYIVNPQVSVRVSAFARRSFTVLGQVGKPNTFLIPGGKEITLLEAIGVAGGFTRVANAKKVTIRRRGETKPITVNLSESSRAGANIRLKDGDVVTVSERLF